MITAIDGLRAHDNLMTIVNHWTDLRARLRPGGGNAVTGMPPGAHSGAPIDIAISDLLFTIEQEARTLGHVLLDETTDWTPRTSRMPWLLADIAQRYGHWTASDDKTATAFCDWAEQYATKVQRVLERPAPATYVGPCQGTHPDGAGCGGELYLRSGHTGGHCRQCGATFTTEEQRAFLAEQFASRLMTQSELVSALVVLGEPVPIATIKSWVHRGRLVEAAPGDGLYRIADALELATGRGRRVSA